MDWLAELDGELGELRRTHRARMLRTIEPLSGGRARRDGRILLNLSGNDYLGISGDAGLRAEFYARYRGEEGSPELAQSSASSRLLTGNTPAYDRLEVALSGLYGGRAALVFNSGYHANIGILPALAGSGDLILSDKLNHASMIDGMRLGDAEFRRYRHLDYAGLRRMLEQLRGQYRRVFLASESIFSMDGDAADLTELVALKREFDAILVIDEAHGVGVRGDGGEGLAGESGVLSGVDILIGTFGKAFGSTGAYAIMDATVREYLINKMRPLIFTTALPPVVLNWSAFVLEKMPALKARRAHLARLGDRLRTVIAGHGFTTGGSSQIVPLMVGDEGAASQLAERLCEAGILVFPIRPPTVPPGTSRLRFSLNAALDMADLEMVEKAL